MRHMAGLLDNLETVPLPAELDIPALHTSAMPLVGGTHTYADKDGARIHMMRQPFATQGDIRRTVNDAHTTLDGDAISQAATQAAGGSSSTTHMAATEATGGSSSSSSSSFSTTLKNQGVALFGKVKEAKGEDLSFYDSEDETAQHTLVRIEPMSVHGRKNYAFLTTTVDGGEEEGEEAWDTPFVLYKLGLYTNGEPANADDTTSEEAVTYERFAERSRKRQRARAAASSSSSSQKRKRVSNQTRAVASALSSSSSSSSRLTRQRQRQLDEAE